MKSIFDNLYILLAVALCWMTSCKSSSEPEPPAEKTIERTVLVYMGADNNLGSGQYDSADIQEMQAGAAAADLGETARLLVYRSAYRKAPVLMEILPDRIDTLAEYDYGVVAATRSRMEDIIATMKDLAPAKKYGLILWGHGTGWLQDGISDDDADYSYGHENSKSMNITTLADILESAGRFDYVYFDCCYMSSAETVYQMRNATNYIVGSATELLTTGMPYHTNLPYLVSGTKEDLIQAAQNTFDLYNAMSGSYRTCTMSVIDTSCLDRLAAATSAIYALCSSFKPDSYTAQRFSDYKTTCYYYDFKDYVHALVDDNGISEDLLNEYDTAFDAAVLYSAATPKLWDSVDLSRCNGLSTYILANSTDITTKNYKDLEWYDAVVSSFGALHIQ